MKDMQQQVTMPLRIMFFFSTRGEYEADLTGLHQRESADSLADLAPADFSWLLKPMEFGPLRTQQAEACLRVQLRSRSDPSRRAYLPAADALVSHDRGCWAESHEDANSRFC
jgi:hypothetical protein